MVVAVWLLPVGAGPGRADQPAEVKAVIDRAVAALGGEGKLAQLRTARWTATGTLHHEGLKLVMPFTETTVAHLPDQFRLEMEYDLNGSKITQILIVDRDRGWNKLGDSAREMPDQYRDGLKDYLYAVSLALTPQVLRDMAFQVSPAGVLTIDDRPTVGLHVTAKGRRDVNVYFDKATGLPVKCEMIAKELEGEAPEKRFELSFSDYKDFDGFKIGAKMTWKQDGKPYVERELTEVKPLAKLDEGALAKP
jgi:hypothetical protein